MQHDWIFDVLRDLRSYALKNGFPALAGKAEEALRVAHDEVAAARARRDQEAAPDPRPTDAAPPKKRQH